VAKELEENLREANEKLPQLKSALDAVRTRRNKILAHLDPMVVSKPDEVAKKSELTVDELHEIFVVAWEILNDVSRRLMLRVPESRMRYVDHVQQHGTALFQRVCEMDLEGIVAKHSLAPYTTERTIWFKIKNRNYSQMQGREELFERERHKEPVACWHSCELACADVEQ
jgi:AbiU2